MATLTDRITVNPNQCGGRPCIRGMRIRVTDVLDLLAHDLTREQIISEHPDLEPEDIRACLRFASDRLNHPVLAACARLRTIFSKTLSDALNLLNRGERLVEISDRV